jgi:hypothetical protein
MIRKKASKRFYVMEINSLILTLIVMVKCWAGGSHSKHSLRRRVGCNENIKIYSIYLQAPEITQRRKCS